ncbi:hypothetical protein ACHHYP_06510 [Achlya hypogyna]|uniref:DDE Tnp4 domain-containing protein n=1 Tax=Achlya hypogyna TaxID=1202772 RepID=A0A1V9YTH4_ACHHY|nr:hypothetical protein ACHHYP_06510 [Achlya hypogyna]
MKGAPPALYVFLLHRQMQRRASRAIPIPRRRFNFERQSDKLCEFNFRFRKSEIHDLFRLFQLPERVITKNRYSAPAIEALCILLHRLAWPTRLGAMVPMFGRSREAICGLYIAVLDHVHYRFGYLLDWDAQRLDGAWMAACAAAIHEQGAPLNTCIGFIDGTVRGICRPSHGVQKAAYNGHKEKSTL